jgi:F-type H+-transporting ATPase subunit delta
MRGDAGAARRYARALLDVALKGGQDAGALRADLDEAVRMLKSSRELQQALEHPALPVEKKKKLLQAVFAGRGSALLLKLLDLLVERRRLALVPHVARTYATLWNAHRGVSAAEAVSAVALSKEEEAALQKALQSVTGKDVELVTRVDPSLLGGLLVNMDGRTYDGSVKTRLVSLREHLGGRTD